VDVANKFHLSRFTPHKVRRVLVHMRSAWDKRISLSQCFVRRYFSQRGIYIASDEPLDVRCGHAFDRLNTERNTHLSLSQCVRTSRSLKLLHYVSLFEMFIDNIREGRCSIFSSWVQRCAYVQKARLKL
jgi:hypothetical protein